MKISESVKEKLNEAVTIWAYENLGDKPRVYAYTMLYKLQKCMDEIQYEIEQSILIGENM